METATPSLMECYRAADSRTEIVNKFNEIHVTEFESLWMLLIASKSKDFSVQVQAKLWNDTANFMKKYTTLKSTDEKIK